MFMGPEALFVPHTVAARLLCRSKDDILAQIRDLQSEMARLESRNSTNKSN